MKTQNKITDLTPLLPEGIDCRLLVRDCSGLGPITPICRRKAEFFSSRENLHQTLDQLDICYKSLTLFERPPKVELCAGALNERWLVSLSHNWPANICLLTGRNDIEAIGVDLEPAYRAIADPEKFLRRICSADELVALGQLLKQRDLRQHALSVFSAKEALIKAFRRDTDKFNYTDYQVFPLENQNDDGRLRPDRINLFSCSVLGYNFKGELLQLTTNGYFVSVFYSYEIKKTTSVTF